MLTGMPAGSPDNYKTSLITEYSTNTSTGMPTVMTASRVVRCLACLTPKIQMFALQSRKTMLIKENTIIDGVFIIPVIAD